MQGTAAVVYQTSSADDTGISTVSFYWRRARLKIAGKDGPDLQGTVITAKIGGLESVPATELELHHVHRRSLHFNVNCCRHTDQHVIKSHFMFCDCSFYLALCNTFALNMWPKPLVRTLGMRILWAGQHPGRRSWTCPCCRLA